MEPNIQLVDTTKYERDRNSKAIISNDASGLAQYKATKQKFSKIQAYGDDINNLKQEMMDIKALLQQILTNQGKGE